MTLACRGALPPAPRYLGRLGRLEAFLPAESSVDLKGDNVKQIPATEAQIQRTITDWLALAGIPFTVTDAAHVTINGVTKGRAKIRRGWPDITACLPPDGTLLAIECKSARGRLRPEQVETIAQLEDAGALTVVARSLEDVTDLIAERLESHRWLDGSYFGSVPAKLVRALAGIGIRHNC